MEETLVHLETSVGGGNVLVNLAQEEDLGAAHCGRWIGGALWVLQYMRLVKVGGDDAIARVKRVSRRRNRETEKLRFNQSIRYKKKKKMNIKMKNKKRE